MTDRNYTKNAYGYGLRQEYSNPRCPQQNNLMECLIHSRKEQRVHRQPFKRPAHANQANADWIDFYNSLRPRQAIGIRKPVATFELAD
ncbi:integrase core domain-containing protein [Thalassococcus sp. BH17M4-6]|uniref:integrase core domain-containing protein n=1 Tax=Thalassococcus sp. BH17M4-6 TaxID=3413148 RepID=UPI003BE80072